ncbi:hypothetical protein N6H13_25985 [Paenibacillus sp. CC-CFT742]|nr:hypothetical protein [Paenibacillus sp. CC-CFT742]WJH28445.1 hypothetical protein N6H13_25985 [Paenibacillus sp. CC-CFT742]
MTPVSLMEELKVFLEKQTAEMIIGPNRLRPNVYLVDLPPRAAGDYEELTDIPATPTDSDERWPFIIVTWGESEDGTDTARESQVGFVFGCHGSGQAGYMDLLHLMESVRIALLKETYEGWSFKIERPLSMGLHDEQTDPYWTGWMTTTWVMPTIEEEVWSNVY